jgi:hypothetical protein
MYLLQGAKMPLYAPLLIRPIVLPFQVETVFVLVVPGSLQIREGIEVPEIVHAKAPEGPFHLLLISLFQKPYVNFIHFEHCLQHIVSFYRIRSTQIPS